MPLEINKRYEVEIIEEGGSRSYVRGLSEAVDGHLLTLKVDGTNRVFNTACSAFVGVKEWKELPKDSIYQPRPLPGSMTMIEPDF